MEDREVIAAFIHEGARTAFGPTSHLEGDCLFLDGWWQVCFRVSPEVFAIRNEPPPRESELREQIALGIVQWEVWAVDEETASRVISARAGEDAFLGDYSTDEPFKEPDYTAELGGARRSAGLPPSIVLTIGMNEDQTRELQGHLLECRFVTRSFDSIKPEMCGAIIPTVVLIDATGQTGKEFVMELRAAACGRFLPVAAVTSDTQLPLGADIALHPSDPDTWVDPIRRLLP